MEKIQQENNEFSDMQPQIKTTRGNANLITTPNRLMEDSMMEVAEINSNTNTKKLKVDNDKVSSSESEDFSAHWAADFVPPGMVEVQV